MRSERRSLKDPVRTARTSYPPRMEQQSRALALQDSLTRYRKRSSDFYDEVLEEVSERANLSGSMGKADIGALVVWKRLNASTRWAAGLMKTPERAVRKATAEAREAALDSTLNIQTAAGNARAALVPLPGFGTGDALASAVIYALAPARMAVYDRRAQAGLERLGLVLTSEPGRYCRYMALVEQLITDSRTFGVDLNSREVDLALFTLGGSER